MKYDDAGWHFNGEFPEDLPDAAGATHIGMFLAWCILNGLGSDRHGNCAARLQDRTVTPGQYLLDECGGKLTDEDLNATGNAFAAQYYGDDTNCPPYLADYSEALDPDERLASAYHIADSWENFDVVAPYIARAYAAWNIARGQS